jgi:hypothetical protein
LLERHCIENLLFLRKLDEYTLIDDPGKREILSKEIKKQFLDPSGRDQINISFKAFEGNILFLTSFNEKESSSSNIEDAL